MKTKFLFVLFIAVFIETSFRAQTITTFYTPDGVDGSGWSYKDYVIPVGMKLDSVYGGFSRIGFPVSAEDFQLEYCAGTNTYNPLSYVSAWNYNTINTSLYNKWIDVTSNGFVSIGMIRASLPTNAGATFDSVKFAISPNVGNCGLLFDSRDGQTYQTVTIGTQCWMKQNLNYGTAVSDITLQFNNSIAEKSCYNSLATNCNTYGGIYTWDEAMDYGTNQTGICPSGWHIPTNLEWNILMSYLGSTAGQQMKASPSTWDGTDMSGFTALPGGIGQGSNFVMLGSRETFWSSTQYSITTDAYDYDLSTGSNSLTEANNNKNSGYCIRCLKDVSTNINLKKEKLQNIRLYPNPASNLLHLEVLEANTENSDIEITNVLGQTVLISKYRSEIDISTLTQGIYNLKILEKNGIISVLRFVKD